jgi:hypothetical protein
MARFSDELSGGLMTLGQDEGTQQKIDDARALIEICETNLVDETEKIIGAWPFVRVDL